MINSRSRIKPLWKVVRRFLRSFFLHSPVLALKYANFRRLTNNKRWILAKNEIDSISELAIKYKDARVLKEMYLAAARFSDQAMATKLEIEWSRLNDHDLASDWRGQNLSECTIWISFKDTDKQGIAIGYDMVGYVDQVIKQAKYTVIVVDERLVSLFKRTFPTATVYSGPKKPYSVDSTLLVTANALILKSVIGSCEDIVDQLFVPFLPDEHEVEYFRKKYVQSNNSSLPVYGISWSPFAYGRLKAPFALWEKLVENVPARFVVIQIVYDDRKDEIESEIASLKNIAPDRVYFDDSVNPYINIDRLASQLSSFDKVVGINSSDISLAAALGIPAYIVCDDLFKRMCPVIGARYPMFPTTHVYGKNGSDWERVFDKLIADLS